MALVERNLLASPTVEDVVEQVSAALRAVWQAQVDASRMAEQQAAAERAALHAYLNNQNAAAHLGTGISAVVTNRTADAEAHDDWGYRGGEDRGRWGRTNRNAVSEHAQGSDTTSDVSPQQSGASESNSELRASSRPAVATPPASLAGLLPEESVPWFPGPWSVVGAVRDALNASRAGRHSAGLNAYLELGQGRALLDVRGPPEVKDQIVEALHVAARTATASKILNELSFHLGVGGTLVIEPRYGLDAPVYFPAERRILVPLDGLHSIATVGMWTGRFEVLEPDLLLVHELIHALADILRLVNQMDIDGALARADPDGVIYELADALRSGFGDSLVEYQAIEGLEQFLGPDVGENAYREETLRPAVHEYRRSASYANTLAFQDYHDLDAYNASRP